MFPQVEKKPTGYLDTKWWDIGQEGHLNCSGFLILTILHSIDIDTYTQVGILTFRLKYRVYDGITQLLWCHLQKDVDRVGDFVVNSQEREKV